MGDSIVRRLAAIAALTLPLAACGSSKTTSHPGSTSGEAGAGGAATTCEPRRERCAGQSLMVCDASGDGEHLQMTCAEGLRCVEAEGRARCDTRACVPGQPMCSDNRVTTCADDGSGPRSGGTSCGARLCEGGKCVDVECEPGRSLCKNRDLLTCGDDGRSIVRVESCTPSEVCDSELGDCVPWTCAPHQSVCEGTVAKTCNAYGSGWLPDAVDCAEDGAQCLAGQCSRQVCEPALRYCRDDNVMQCNLQGDTLVLQHACNHATEHCEAFSGGFAECYSDVCVPGVVGCDKNAIKTCNDEGVYPVDGEDCGEQWCIDGECSDDTCQDGTYLCQGSDVYICLFQHAPQLVQTCDADSVCRATGTVSDPGAAGGVFCGPRGCAPGKSSCFANQIGTCRDDGEGLAKVTGDCAADGEVCTAQLTCAASAVDALGVDEHLLPLYSDALTANLVEISSARTLTQLKAWLVFPAARQLRWVVYEQSGAAFVAKVDKLMNVSSSSGFVTSPLFDFALEPGKRYLLGVAVSGGDVTGYYDTAPLSRRASFGLVFGQVTTTYAASYDFLDSFDSEAVLNLEVTTRAP